MPYLVDTDVLIDCLGGEEDAIRLLDRLADDGIAISIITYMEVYQGVLRAPDREVAERQLDEGSLFDPRATAVEICGSSLRRPA